MSEGISAPFIRYPIGTSLMMAGILFVGLVAYPLLPVAPLPQVDFPTISVSATLPGASPETMAATVATPLERSLGRIAGVTEITSSSSLGSTRVVLRAPHGGAERTVLLSEQNKDLYHTSMESKRVKLSALGQFYWSLAKKGRI